MLAADPAHAEAHNALGLSLLQSDDARGALAHLREAAERTPDDNERLYNLGVCKLKLKDYASRARVSKVFQP